MRIYKCKFYIAECIPGLSGFQRWNERERYVISGHRASGSDRINVICQYNHLPNEQFRLEDGHLPDHQPTTTDPRQFLRNKPYQRAVFINHHTEGLTE